METPCIVPEHLQDIFNQASEGKSSEEIKLIRKVLCKFSDIFIRSDSDLGITDLVKHSIDTGNTKPIKQPPRRLPLAYAEEERKIISQMEENGIIRKSRSPWASPLCLVLRKNGKIRPCVEYRKLNAVTNPDAFPLPRVQDCLDAVAGAKYFSTFDLTSGYHQVPMTFMCTRNIPKTDEIGTSGSSMENLPYLLR